jgi:hypothetical protein
VSTFLSVAQNDQLSVSEEETRLFPFSRHIKEHARDPTNEILLKRTHFCFHSCTHSHTGAKALCGFTPFIIMHVKLRRKKAREKGARGMIYRIDPLRNKEGP